MTLTKVTLNRNELYAVPSDALEIRVVFGWAEIVSEKRRKLLPGSSLRPMTPTILQAGNKRPLQLEIVTT